jgi:hypothetical protein
MSEAKPPLDVLADVAEAIARTVEGLGYNEIAASLPATSSHEVDQQRRAAFRLILLGLQNARKAGDNARKIASVIGFFAGPLKKT